MSITLYPDSKPHNLEISDLQKGLVLRLNDTELIEEGIGFGAPVVKYHDELFFSSSAETFLSYDGSKNILLSKSFNIDSVSRKRIWRGPYINQHFYLLLHRAFHGAYTGRKHHSPILDRLIELRKVFGINTNFLKVKPRGKIKIAYKCFSDVISVEVDISNLDRYGCKEILILNEQGSTFFRSYFDTTGLKLFDGHIGAWEKVESDEASLSDVKRSLVFTLKNINGATLYRGFERVKGRFSWAGLGYSLRPNIASKFTYTIEVKRES